MPKKNNLFLLIQSLTKAEKRYFKLFAATNNANANYLLLFDAIDKQDEYDEQAIKKQFGGKPFIKQLHVTKNYLSRLILKSLRNYHSKLSKEAELKDLLRDIEILFRRELFDQCNDSIEKAKAIALEFEKRLDLLEICNWKRKLLLAKYGAGKSREEINTLICQEKASLDAMLQEKEYWHLTINIFDELYNDTHSSGQPSAVMPNHPLLKNPGKAKTFQAKILYYYILQSYYFFEGNYKKAEAVVSELIRFIESCPGQIKDNPATYFKALNNKTGICLHLKNYRKVEQLLKKIRTLPGRLGLKNDDPITTKMILHTYNLELEMYRDTRQIDEGIVLVDEVTSFLKKNPRSISDNYRLLLYYQFAYLFFLKNECEKSLFWLNEIFRRKLDSPREDILSYAQLLRLIIHFELDNITILKYMVDACRRFLKKKRNLYQFEKALLRFFSKASLAYPEDYPQLFQKLNAELFIDTDEKMIKSALDYLDFKRWVDGKVKRNASF